MQKETPEISPSDRRAEVRAMLHEVIFEADTPAGKLFDILLIASILASVFQVCLLRIKAGPFSIFIFRSRHGRACVRKLH